MFSLASLLSDLNSTPTLWVCLPSVYFGILASKVFTFLLGADKWSSTFIQDVEPEKRHGGFVALDTGRTVALHSGKHTGGSPRRPRLRREGEPGNSCLRGGADLGKEQGSPRPQCRRPESTAARGLRQSAPGPSSEHLFHRVTPSSDVKQ